MGKLAATLTALAMVLVLSSGGWLYFGFGLAFYCIVFNYVRYRRGPNRLAAAALVTVSTIAIAIAVTRIGLTLLAIDAISNRFS